MAFGPTDRNEVIELKGLEEHEREREGVCAHERVCVCVCVCITAFVKVVC